MHETRWTCEPASSKHDGIVFASVPSASACSAAENDLRRETFIWLRGLEVQALLPGSEYTVENTLNISVFYKNSLMKA